MYVQVLLFHVWADITTVLCLLERFPRPWQTIGPVSGPFNSADSSIKRAWKTTRSWHGLGPDRSASYPLFVVRKPAPTVARERRAKSDTPGVSSGGGGGVRRKLADHARAPPPPLLALLLLRVRWWPRTPSRLPALWPRPKPGARGRRRRSPMRFLESHSEDTIMN